MAGAYVQQWTDGSSATTDSFTLTIDNTGTGAAFATSGNLLVGVISILSGGDTFTTPTGWTLIQWFSNGTYGAASYYRLATGDANDDFAASWTDTGRPTAFVAEFSGLDSTSPFEDSAEDETNISSNTTSQGTGTATPASSNGMAIAFLSVESSDNWVTGESINNSFTDMYYNFAGTSNRIGIAYKTYTSTAGQSATWSTTDTGDRAWGAMAVFKESTGAATNPKGPLGHPLAGALGGPI